MSMGLSELTAEDVVNKCDEKILKLIIKFLGEETESSKIVRNIIHQRKLKKISLVSDLVKIIENSKKKNYQKNINLSTKTFQAIRMFVNKEVTELVSAIIKASELIKPSGKIVIISFHSIEDKIVKFFFNNY